MIDGNQKKTKTNGNGKYKEKKVDELHYIDQKLEENNGNAYFDWLIAMPIGCGYCVSLQILIPFLIQMPSFLWSNDGSSWNSCLASDFWNAVSPPMHMFDNSASSTITNWITDRNLICISSFNLGLFGSIYMCGYAFGALTILRLGDIIGRKPILVLWSASNTIIYFLLYFTRETYLIYGLLFIDGAMRMTKGSLAYILMLETIPMKKRSKLNSTEINKVNAYNNKVYIFNIIYNKS